MWGRVKGGGKIGGILLCMSGQFDIGGPGQIVHGCFEGFGNGGWG